MSIEAYLRTIPESGMQTIEIKKLSKNEFFDGLERWCDEKLGTEEYENRKKAMGIIADCYHYNWEEISFANLGLTSIAEEICALESLKILDLSGNQIEALPSNLHQLTNLQQLTLDNNPLRSVPIGLLCLPNRCEISLKECEQLDLEMVEHLETQGKNTLHGRGWPCHRLCTDF